MKGAKDWWKMHNYSADIEQLKSRLKRAGNLANGGKIDAIIYHFIFYRLV